MKKPSIALAVVALALAGASAAGAHMLRHHARMTAGQQLSYANRTISHARAVVGWARRDLRRVKTASRRTTDSPDPERAGAWGAHVLRVRLLLRDHRWLLRYGRRQLAAANARLLPAHYAGWSCITNGAYPGAPHEGDGYAGPYSGPLGMTTPWLGHRPPGSDWVHSPVAAVYAIAEREAAANGFRPDWMRGQWPNTYPPCARFF